MTLLLSGVCAAGMIANKILLELGMRSMLTRYLMAVCVSYGVFFILMRLWLSYVSPAKTSTHSDIDIVNSIDLGQGSTDLFSGGGTAVSEAPFTGGGGDFGGAGATDAWGESSSISLPVRSAILPNVSSGHGASGGSSSSSGGWSLDLGDEGIVLILLALLVLVIFGAGAYLIYAAPEILSEAAFQALLAAGLIKASREITRKGWMGSVFKATVVPFLVVLAMTAIFGLAAQYYYPHATRVADIFTHLPAEKR